MRLDRESLEGAPILAQLVNESAVGRSGALELLSDDYKAPQPPVLHISQPDIDSDDDESTDDDEPESLVVSPEVDADGYPAMVSVPRPAPQFDFKGVSLIRPRTLTDVFNAY